MSATSSIEWLQGGATWNFLVGCSPASRGCVPACYAEAMTRRLAGSLGGPYADAIKAGRWSGQVSVREEKLEDPERWAKPRLVFANSMSDTFHSGVPDAVLDRAFGTIERADWHTYLLLTKRAARMRDYLRRRYPNGAPKHIWAGASVCEQRDDHQIPPLLETPVAVRFLSCEPLVGALDLTTIDYGAPPPYHMNALQGFVDNGRPTQIDWVIAGGETSGAARPTHPAWVRSLRDQCSAARVPFFFKSWGEWAPFYACADDPDARAIPEVEAPRRRWLNLAGGHGFHGEEVVAVERVGKKRAGRLLDGRTHDEMPEEHHA